MWFKADDDLAFHRKTLRAGNAAMGLWIRAGTWLRQPANARPDAPGVITYAELRQMGTAAEIKKLIDAGGPGGTGFLEPIKYQGERACRFHDWQDYQPLPENLEATRDQWKERKRRQRAHRAGDHTYCNPDWCDEAPPAPEPPDEVADHG